MKLLIVVLMLSVANMAQAIEWINADKANISVCIGYSGSFMPNMRLDGELKEQEIVFSKNTIKAPRSQYNCPEKMLDSTRDEDINYVCNLLGNSKNACKYKCEDEDDSYIAKCTKK